MPELDTAAIDQIARKVFREGGNFADEAEPYTIDEMLRIFGNLRSRMTSLLDGLTLDQINYNPDPLSYSLSEVVTHLTAAQGAAYNGFIDLSASTLPHIDPVPRGAGAGAEKGTTAEVLRERLQKATDDLIAVVHKTYDPANVQRIEAPRLGIISYKGLMLFQLAHDLDHVKQAQTVRRSPGFPKKEA